jgi:hypothetical protein
LVFEKNAIFFAENWQKSQKIVILTSTPDETVNGQQNKKSLINFDTPTAWRHPLLEQKIAGSKPCQGERLWPFRQCCC